MPFFAQQSDGPIGRMPPDGPIFLATLEVLLVLWCFTNPTICRRLTDRTNRTDARIFWDYRRGTSPPPFFTNRTIRHGWVYRTNRTDGQIFFGLFYPNYHRISTTNILYHNKTVPFTKFTDGTHGIYSIVLGNPRIVRNYGKFRRYNYLSKNTYKKMQKLFV